MKKILANYKKAIIIFISFFIISRLVTIILFFTIDYNSFLSDSSYSFALSDVIYSIIMLIIIAYFDKKNKTVNKTDLSYDKNYSFLLLLILGSILFRVCIDPIIRLDEILNISNLPAEDQRINKTVYENIFIFLDVVLLAPIIEEIVFRGYILNALNKIKFNSKILLSSLLFTLIHVPLELTSLIPVFILGVILGYIAMRFKLIYAIIFHALYNLIWFIIDFNSNDYWDLISSLNFRYTYWGLVLICLSAFLLVFKKIHHKKSPI
ncbi:CPBP family intramembrane metalloprotease [Flavivirga amylovorans]|uniref:CPBP family intramembrane metalloprotease n=1 Tax=Flavivirga amylovorans TaxID=870486 RepID=A0ABT8WZK6_9FLAO|nr:CPBP family intramembrane glutamic endopeptidase [Flavivirga amylovorans]MDO5987072.1 CPBP family intramembrane metalloprotease [Flavivirga amylovorans]